MKTRRIEKRLLIGVILFWIMVPCFGHAVPQKINYQGYLTNSAGVPVNGTVQIVFTIYNVGGTTLWTETQNILVASGVYNVNLGEVTPITLGFDVPYYLGVRVGTDSEMTPRQALVSVPYAFRAGAADAVIGAGTFSQTILSSVTTGTPPLQISSTTAVANLNADLLDGQHASAFITVVNAEAAYVNVSGDSMSGAVVDTVLNVNNTGTGETGDGVRGYAHATSGSGVFGIASGTNGNGVSGFAHGTSGSGVYGYSSSNSGRGVSGSVSGTDGRGVHGIADNTGNVTNYGGYFEAYGTSGRGVYGYVNGSDGHGVHGVAAGSYGVGVYGFAPVTGDYPNYGGYFEAYGNYGQGVYGYANGTYGAGIHGFAAGTDGTGVGGIATGTSGVGVYGSSTTGDGVKGESSGSGKSGVYGNNTGGGYGVYGNVTAGTGVFGHSYYHYGMFAESQQGTGLTARHIQSGNFADIGTANAALKATGTNGNAIEAHGDLYVTGAHKGGIGPNGGAPFPRPAYDSGWVNLRSGDGITLDTGLPPPLYSNDNFFIKLRGRIIEEGGPLPSSLWYRIETDNKIWVQNDTAYNYQIKMWIWYVK